MRIDDAFNHQKVIGSLEALIVDGKRLRKKVFLILDKLGVHHGKPVRTKAKVRAAVPSHTVFIETNPECAKSCVQGPRVKDTECGSQQTAAVTRNIIC